MMTNPSLSDRSFSKPRMRKLGYKFNVGGAPWELFLSGRNIFNVKYYGFTEPDPDGNSYQPAATASWTINLKIR